MRPGALARVLLIRHAQASYGTHDYDRLSERGHLQAGLLARWLHASDFDIRAISLGAHRRHAQTLDAIVQAAAELGDVRLPAAEVDPDWNEFDHDSLLRAYAAWAPQDQDLASLAHGNESAKVQAVLTRAFQAWAEGAVDAAMPESLAAFRERVGRAHRRVQERCTDGTALVISSAGAIARCAQVTFGLNEAATIELNMKLANSGVVEFTRSAEQWSIARWSALPHLEPAEHAHLKSWY